MPEADLYKSVWISQDEKPPTHHASHNFVCEKNQNLLDRQEHCICKLGKIWNELKLLLGVYYWILKLYTGIIWHSYFPSHGIS